MKHAQTHIPCVLSMALLAAMSVPQFALAYGPKDQPGAANDGLPSALEGVGVDEHLGAQLPLDATFIDENGDKVGLGKYFQGKRPVILQLGYYGCPMLCGLVSRGLTEAAKQIDLVAGADYDVIYMSFDPKEKAALAAAKKKSYMEALGRPEQAGGWHFLTTDETSAQRVAETAGFKYRWDDRSRQWSHAAVLIVVMPDGKISRYLYGVQFEPKTLRLSLVEASQGKTGSVGDKFLLFCFHYDPQTGKYSFAIANIMRAAGVLTVLVLGFFIWRFLRREKQQSARLEAPDTP